MQPLVLGVKFQSTEDLNFKWWRNYWWCLIHGETTCTGGCFLPEIWTSWILAKLYNWYWLWQRGGFEWRSAAIWLPRSWTTCCRGWCLPWTSKSQPCFICDPWGCPQNVRWIEVQTQHWVSWQERYVEKLQCFGFFGWCGRSPRMKIEEFHDLLVVIGDCFTKTGTNLHAIISHVWSQTSCQLETSKKQTLNEAGPFLSNALLAP